MDREFPYSVDVDREWERGGLKEEEEEEEEALPLSVCVDVYSSSTDSIVIGIVFSIQGLMNSSSSSSSSSHRTRAEDLPLVKAK